MADKLRKNTLMQLQVSLPKKIVITAVIMAALILLVFYCDIPNPNMILIAGLVLCSALFGYGGGIVAAVIMLGYTLFFFSTDHSFTQFTPQNTQKVIVSIIGIVADMLLVCELKRAEIRQFKAVDAVNAALQREAASLDTIHEMLTSGRWAMDFNKEGVMVEVKWSDEFRRMLGYHSREDFPDVLESWSDLLHPDDKERVLKEFQDTIFDYTGQKTYDVEYRLLTKNRGYRWYRAVGKLIRRPDGSPVTYVGIFIDITERKETAQNLSAARRMADIDSLTGVKNKHAYTQWEEIVNEGIKGGTQEPFAVVVCDINNLKSVNDLYGHKAGDSCIQSCSSKLCNIFTNSPVFRVGGDEFIIFLSGEDYYRRNELMTRVNAIPKDPARIRMGETVSAGMAEYDKDKHRSLLNVVEEADKAMYARKQYLKETVLKTDDKPESETASDYIPVIHARKAVLIADDIEMNREILGDLLEEDYDIFYAADGVETLQVLRDHAGEIDLVLLDLIMPNMSGREVIAEMQLDEELVSVPVIILTTDQKAELDCLRIGAMDFIPKPYPDIEIVKARINKCIELSEDRDLIRHTERDKLTGLLNKDYFFRYVYRLDHIYKDTTLDAVVCDVNRFYAINQQYGRKFGDRVLSDIGAALRKLARQIGGIGCRQGGDTFLLYCPHQEDYASLLRQFTADIFAEEETADKVSLRFGVFANAKREPDAEERFARASAAAERIKDDPDTICGYDDET